MATSPAKPFKVTDAFNTLSAEWMAKSAEMAALKPRELELRNQLVKMVMPKGVTKGTHNFSLPEGWVCKIEGKVNIKVDETLLPETRKLVADMIESEDVPPFDLDSVIIFKPEISISAFNALTAEQQHLVKNCLTITDGQPSLSIVKPKRAVK